MKNLFIFALLLLGGVAQAQVKVPSGALVKVPSGGVVSLPSGVSLSDTLPVDGSISIGSDMDSTTNLLQLTSTAGLTLDGVVWYLPNNQVLNSLSSIDAGKLVVRVGNSLEVTSRLETSNGGLVWMDADSTGYGQLKHPLGATTGDGYVVEQYVSDTIARYIHLGSPVTATYSQLQQGSSILKVSPDNTGNLWQWDSDSGIYSADFTVNDQFQVGQGCSFYLGTNQNGTFGMSLPGTVQLQGALLNASASITLGWNNGLNSNVGFQNSITDGWNLVSNPYPCIVDWDGISVPGGANGIAVWHSDDSLYGYWNNGVGVNAQTQYIAPMQGFWVRVDDSTNASNLSIPGSARVFSPTVPFQKKGPDDYAIWMSVGRGISSHQCYVGINPQAKELWDGYDQPALRDTNGKIAIATYVGGKAMAINRMPEWTTPSYMVPVALYGQKKGESLTLRLDSFWFKPGWIVKLEDLVTGQIHDFTQGQPYHFKGDTINRRFNLHFNPKGLGVGEFDYAYGIYISQDMGTKNIRVKFDDPINAAEVIIYDLLGREVINLSDQNTLEDIVIPMEQYPAAAYMVAVKQKYTTKTGKVVFH